MKAHTKLILSLVAHIREQRERIEALEGHVEGAEDRANHYEQLAGDRAQSLRELEHEAHQARQEEGYRDYQRNEVLRKLGRAREFGDTWAEQRLLRELETI